MKRVFNLMIAAVLILDILRPIIIGTINENLHKMRNRIRRHPV